jgi:hypothetical protein
VITAKTYATGLDRLFSETLRLSLMCGVLFEFEWKAFYSAFLDHVTVTCTHINKRLRAHNMFVGMESGVCQIFHRIRTTNGQEEIQPWGYYIPYIPGDWGMDLLDLLLTQVLHYDVNVLTDNERVIYDCVFTRLNDAFDIQLPAELQTVVNTFCLSQGEDKPSWR